MIYNIYLNVIKMITYPEYRNLELEDKNIIDKNKFSTEININGYIFIKCRKKENKMFDTIFYILQKDSTIIRLVAEFKKIMNSIPKDIKYVYFISNLYPSQQIIRLSKHYKYIINIIKNKIFICESPKHEIVPKHEILDPDEIDKLIFDLSLGDILYLPNIAIDDAQSIWIGAKSKDIIKIIRNDSSIYYRVVIGLTEKKIISYNKSKEYKNIDLGEKIIIEEKKKKKTNKDKEPYETLDGFKDLNDEKDKVTVESTLDVGYPTDK